MNLAETFLARLAEDPARSFVEGDGGRASRGEVRDLGLRVSAALQAAGAEPGDRVALSLPKGRWLPACHLGVLAAGAAPLPLDPAHADASLGALVARAGARLAIVDPELARRGLGFAPDVAWWVPEDLAPPEGAAPLRAEGVRATGALVRDDTDLALLAFTSGTTGRPKGVPLSHGNLASNLEALARVWAWSERDRLLHVLPVFHLHGLGVALYGSLRAGNPLVFHERFDPQRVLAEAGPTGIRLLMAVPTMLHRLVQAAGEPSRALAGLRAVISGSAALPPPLFARFRETFGLEPVERYGMSETVMNASNPVGGARKAGSVGPPLPGVEVGLRGLDGADAGDGPGELWVRGPNVFGGYWEDPEATAAAFAGEWFRTGDLGRRDADGYLFLTGRVKELIVTGGYNVSPVAVEAALEAESEAVVRELAVGSLPDPDLGERVAAFVVTSDAADWAALVERLHARAAAKLPRYARPREYRRLATLPRTAMGKVQRARLADAQAVEATARGRD